LVQNPERRRIPAGREDGRIMLVIVVEASTPVPTHRTPLQYSGILLTAAIQK
jgi:hypothetical protein